MLYSHGYYTRWLIGQRRFIGLPMIHFLNLMLRLSSAIKVKKQYSNEHSTSTQPDSSCPATYRRYHIKQYHCGYRTLEVPLRVFCNWCMQSSSYHSSYRVPVTVAAKYLHTQAWRKCLFPCKLGKISLQQGRFPSSVGWFPLCISLFFPFKSQISRQGASRFACFFHTCFTVPSKVCKLTVATAVLLNETCIAGWGNLHM